MHVISVVMSIYSEPVEWICYSISSILNQTYEDFEFIIVNDKPDRSENKKILKEYLKKDIRIKIIENKQNIGLTKSLNKGLNIATGKYIARMDADDIAMPQRLQKQYDFLEANKDYVLCGSYAEKINDRGEKIGYLVYPAQDQEIRDALILKNQMNHPTLFYLNDSSLRYDESIKYAQDYDFVIKAAKKGKVSNVGENLLKYRVSSQQIGNRKLVEQDFFANKIRQDYIAHILDKKYNILYKNGSVEKKVRQLYYESRSICVINIYFTMAVYLKKVRFKFRLIDFVLLPMPFVRKLQFLLAR